MEGRKIIAIILLIAGSLGLLYGGFTYTKDTHKADIGPLSLSMSEKEHVNIPLWLSIAAIGVGGVLLVIGRKRL